MNNPYRWILQLADGEDVIFVVVKSFNFEADKPISSGTLDDVRDYLDKFFENGFGFAVNTFPHFTAWTKSWVISAFDYDGSVVPYRVPRHPTEAGAIASPIAEWQHI